MFNIEVSSDAACLLADHVQWNRLSRGVPFRETSWLGPWWSHFGGGDQAHVVVVRDQLGEIRGLLPLYRRGGNSGERTLAIMGDGAACSDHVSVLAKDEDVRQIGYEIGQHLAETASCPRRGWEALDIDGVVEGDHGMTALAQGLKAGGAALHASSRMSVWFKPADANWEEHLKHYGKTQRRKMRRWSEKIGDHAPFQQRVAKTDEQAVEMIDALIRMHQQRWNEVGESGSFATPEFCEFTRDAARGFLSRNLLYVTALEHARQIIAAELSFIGGNGILYVFSAGFDTTYAEMEPGRILSVDSLRYLYRQSLTGIDYLRGDEEYKKRYTTESRRLIRMRAVAPTLMPRLKHAAWCTGFELKQWVRRKTGRQPIAVLDLTGGQPPLSELTPPAVHVG